ncbi:VWA domain-containing protein [Arenimonas caeni]|uniref:VWA domain-containing protein n=1 Tax=Arenimonas caeni TaxID=2058085 RepID=UPI00196468C7|nr:VWA domain-containing protein [Arenimonas caeni]
MPRKTRAALPALALLSLATGLAQAGENAIIVLDASGSMWGQINGKPKLEIARETLATVLADAPDDLALGLMAYGHREKGNCNDIELVVPVRTGSAGDIAEAAATMKFLGMTPLSEAVSRAAGELKFTEQKATVILITDGLETCKADPCALGTELEQSGVDFTAHVVGFGLSAEEGKQVACLAENTGGRYIAANDADGLAAALTETVVEAPPPAPLPEASLDAPATVPMSSRFLVGWDGPAHQYDEVQVFDPRDRGGRGKVIDNQRVLGDRRADDRQVELVAPAKPGQYLLRYYHGAQSRVIATREITVTEADVALTAPDEVAIASNITVGWTGPGERYDEVQVFDPAARGGRGHVVDNKRVLVDGDAGDNKVVLVAPATPGEYQLRYWNGDNSTVLATRALRVVEAEVALTAPDEVAIASNIVVGWTGPGARYDEVQVFDPAARGGRGHVVDNKRVLDNGDPGKREVVLVAPAKPGDYLLRYWNGDNNTELATRPLKVVAAEVALEAPALVPAASYFTVGWTGPGARYDHVQVHDPDDRGGRGKVIDNQRVQSDKGFDQRQVTMTAPARPGRYELRYWNGDNNAALHVQPLEVTAVQVSFDAPARGAAGQTITIGWTGPGARYDEVQVHDPNDRGGRGKVLASRRLQSDAGYDQRKASLKLPDAPGTYELRYWNGDNSAVMHVQPIIVE